VGDLVRGHDWSATPLGTIAGWPPTVRAIVQTLLLSPIPMVAIWGEDGILVYNGGYAEVCGPRHPEALGGRLLEFWPEARAFNARVIESGLAGQALSFQAQELELWRLGRPEKVWMDLDYTPILDEAGRPVGMLATVLDITERVLAGRRLAESEDRFRFLDSLARATADAHDAGAILEATTRLLGEHLGVSNCAYADMDADGDGFTIRGNWHVPDAPSILGHYSLADFGELAVRELGAGRPLVINDNRAEISPHEARTFQDIGIAATICMPLVKEGRLTALMAIHHAAPHRWSDAELALLREVTERCWAYIERVGAEGRLRELNETLESRVAERTEELLKAEDALRQSQKLEAIGQLTGGVAHDFNNLLTIIRSSVDFLRRPELPEARKARYLDAVSETVERAAKLTGQLLAFARRQTLDPQVLALDDRLRAVADLIDTVTGARIRVVLDIADAPCLVRADLNQFETALVNMAVNARDAMDGEGTLTLRLSRRGALPPIRRHAGSSRPFVAVSLSDTGSGIAPEVLPRIFEPFFTTKEVGKGTGLGLSQVFGFAKQSGGDVDVESAPGGGATFTLYLPEVAAEAVEDPKGETAPFAPATNSGQRVLVVEDNVEVGTFATQILEDLGYRTTWAANAEEALDRIGLDGSDFDVVFSDVVMPGMGGLALAKELRRRLPHLPVLLASGYSHVLAQDGHDGFRLLHKPYSAEQLGKLLQQVTARQSAHGQARTA
jgi:PAS domain S-box-containing protein